MSLSTAFMNFTTGVLEADKKNTKENLLIRGKELDAKRNAVLEMKKSKYNDEIEGVVCIAFTSDIPATVKELELMSNNEKNITPNYNFDLCRLAITILYVLDFNKDKDYKEKQPFFNFIYNLTLNNQGESFFDLNDDFTLYKIISEEATNSLPCKIIQKYIFNQYRIKKKYFPKKFGVHFQH